MLKKIKKQIVDNQEVVEYMIISVVSITFFLVGAFVFK